MKVLCFFLVRRERYSVMVESDSYKNLEVDFKEELLKQGFDPRSDLRSYLPENGKPKFEEFLITHGYSD